MEKEKAEIRLSESDQAIFEELSEKQQIGFKELSEKEQVMMLDLYKRDSLEKASLERTRYLKELALALVDRCKDEKITVIEFKRVHEMMFNIMEQNTTLHHDFKVRKKN